jgi:hypothetical protein
MRHLVAVSLLVLVTACAGEEAEPPAEAPEPYVPQAVFCADGSGVLCGVMPSMIGLDPGIAAGVGYEGLADDVPAFERDAQTPFDNMAWQMFVALNQIAGGEYAWQGYTRVEEVFGPAPAPLCPNPGGLPVFALTSKSDGQPSDRDEEFLQAATDKPLIDRNGNWTLFERRLNDVELAYLKNEKWDLTTLAGQQAFIAAGHSVDFTPSEDATDGALGAVELKLAWRVLDPAKGDDPGTFLTLDALLAVDASEVRGGAGPICDPVQLGLVGFHIIQKNPERDALRPQWIWASFEHQDNAPFSPDACDPVDGGCYLTKDPPPPVCTTPADPPGTFSYFDAACTDGGKPCAANQPPAILDGEKEYLWSPDQPYAGAYLYEGRYGTQVARCWRIYDLTEDLNEQWQGKLAAAGSALANYVLIGTQWGGNVEPRPGVFVNGGVPAFLSNATLETYIQTAEIGTCLGCHQDATLAYEAEVDGKKVTYDANFSFLLGLAE